MIREINKVFVVIRGINNKFYQIPLEKSVTEDMILSTIVDSEGMFNILNNPIKLSKGLKKFRKALEKKR